MTRIYKKVSKLRFNIGLRRHKAHSSAGTYRDVMSGNPYGTRINISAPTTDEGLKPLHDKVVAIIFYVELDKTLALL